MKNPLRKWTDRLAGKWENILICSCEIVIGILMVIKPMRFTAGIIIAAGFLCMLLGIKSIIHYFRTDIVIASVQKDLFKGLLLSGCGLYLAIRSVWFTGNQKVLTIVYGTAILILGAQKIQWTVNLLRWKKPNWYVAAVSAGLAVVLAVVTLINPFADNRVLWIIFGSVLLIEAALDIAALILTSRKRKAAKSAAAEPHSTVSVSAAAPQPLDDTPTGTGDHPAG